MTVSITNKVSQVTTDCVYRIATGAWPAGSKLPSLRQGTAIWGVDALTVKRAYEVLETKGLVEIAPRSGVYVRDNASVVGLRKNLAHLAEEILLDAGGRMCLAVDVAKEPGKE